MKEVLLSLKVEVTVTTNRLVYVQKFVQGEQETVEQFMERVKRWTVLAAEDE